MDVKEIAERICNKAKTVGINGVRFFRARLEPGLKYNEIADEMSKERYDIYVKSFVCFIIDDPSLPPSEDSPYVETFVDRHGLMRDLVAEVKKEYGEKCIVNFSDDYGEFEVYTKEWDALPKEILA